MSTQSGRGDSALSARPGRGTQRVDDAVGLSPGVRMQVCDLCDEHEESVGCEGGARVQRRTAAAVPPTTMQCGRRFDCAGWPWICASRLEQAAWPMPSLGCATVVSGGVSNAEAHAVEAADRDVGGHRHAQPDQVGDDGGGQQVVGAEQRGGRLLAAQRGVSASTSLPVCELMLMCWTASSPASWRRRARRQGVAARGRRPSAGRSPARCACPAGPGG